MHALLALDLEVGVVCGVELLGGRAGESTVHVHELGHRGMLLDWSHRC
jgi:hypothetical protein